jgi:hypothetical protein
MQLLRIGRADAQLRASIDNSCDFAADRIAGAARVAFFAGVAVSLSGPAQPESI